jgi:hypothetical protein
MNMNKTKHEWIQEMQYKLYQYPTETIVGLLESTFDVLNDLNHDHTRIKEGKSGSFAVKGLADIVVNCLPEFLKIFEDEDALSFEKLLPEHYTEVVVPLYKGKGEHSVRDLENIIEKQEEKLHQMQLVLQKFTEI